MILSRSAGLVLCVTMFSYPSYQTEFSSPAPPANRTTLTCTWPVAINRLPRPRTMFAISSYSLWPTDPVRSRTNRACSLFFA